MARASPSDDAVEGSGTRPVTGSTMSGRVPHVTSGASAVMSIVTSASKRASRSLASVFQCATAAVHASPAGACGRPSRNANVVASGAISALRAPASILMLQIVIRCSMDSWSMSGPAISSANPEPPDTPSRPIKASATSLAVTPRLSEPVRVIRIAFGFCCARHCVARTCSTSLVPMPKASAPNAPCVLVWLSPHTIVAPGRVRPSSGPITCTMPWRPLSKSKSGTPNALALSRSVSTCCRASGSAIGKCRAVVGTL